MTAQQNAKVQMYYTVRVTCNAHASAWTGFLQFATPYNQFNALLGQISGDISLQDTDSTGYTDQKGALRVSFTARLQQMADTLVLLGKSIGNMPLQNDSYTTATMFRDYSEEHLLGRADRLVGLANTNLSALTPLGINSAFITATTAAQTSFMNAISTPGHAQAESVRGTQNLALHIGQLDAYVESMDTAAEVLQYTQPAFYSEYITSRKIVDAGSTARALDVTVLDGATQEPLAGATATINPGGLEKASAAQGRFYVQSLAAGSYTMVISKANFQPQTVSFEVDGAGGVQLTIQLHPAS